MPNVGSLLDMPRGSGEDETVLGAGMSMQDLDVKALTKACEWIERSTSERMKCATAEFIYDRYIRNPSMEKTLRWHEEGPHGGPPQ